MELTICEKWTMEIPEHHGEGAWFLDWVLKAPHQRSTAAGWASYQALAQVVPKIDSVVEYFGGLGTQALMIRDLWSPAKHVALDYSPESAAHLKDQFSDVEVYQANSYDPLEYRPAELITLDFGDFTIWKSRVGQPHGDLLNRVFAGDPKAVTMTDIAARYRHLHRDRYETLLGAGRCASYPDYLEAVADRFEALYGYTLVGGHYNGNHNAVLAFAQEGERATVKPIPERPVGLEVTR